MSTMLTENAQKERRLPKGISKRADGRYQGRFTFQGERHTFYDRDLKALQKKMADAQYEMEHGIYMDAKNIMNFGFASFKNEPVNGAETFLQEQDPVELGGNTYPASRLRLEEAVITVPLAAQFSDAVRTVETDMPQGHPAAAVARLVYTYNDRKVGSGYIYDTELEAQLAAEEASRAAEEASRAAKESLDGAETESREAENVPAPEETEGTGNPPGPLSGIPLTENQILILAAVLVLAAVLGCGMILVARKRRRERIARQQRRERRRQRLQEIGYNEEDFEKLMQKRRENGKGQGRDRNP